MNIFRKIFILFTLLVAVAFQSCNTVDDNRIPSYPVNLNLASPDLWSIHGVSGYGEFKLFIKELRIPKDFAYTDRTVTGYGGVLLISGVNPFTLEAGVPMAYDLACPVEAMPDVRVSIQTDGLVPEAVCPKCGSHYDVVERAGSPISGPAFSSKVGLRRFECREGQFGGYLIVNY